MRDILPIIPDWIANHDPREVKYHLSRFVRFTAHPDKRVVGELLE